VERPEPQSHAQREQRGEQTAAPVDVAAPAKRPAPASATASAAATSARLRVRLLGARVGTVGLVVVGGSNHAFAPRDRRKALLWVATARRQVAVGVVVRVLLLQLMQPARPSRGHPRRHRRAGRALQRNPTTAAPVQRARRRGGLLLHQT